MKTIRPLLNLISLLCIDYHPKRFLGRIMTFWTLFSNLLIILVIELLRKWVIAQLSILIALSAITIIFSLPKMIYKTTIGTELGFIIISILFLVLGLLQNSDGASNSDLRLILSWIGVGTNIAIVLFHIIVRIIEFFRLRKEKKREEENEKNDWRYKIQPIITKLMPVEATLHLFNMKVSTTPIFPSANHFMSECR